MFSISAPLIASFLSPARADSVVSLLCAFALVSPGIERIRSRFKMMRR
jgi:hypothetical protein